MSDFIGPSIDYSPSLNEQAVSPSSLNPGKMELFWQAFKGQNSPIKQMYDAYEYYKTKAEGEGPQLNQDEINDLQKDRPNLNIPVGTHQNIANLIVQNYDADRRRNLILQSAKPGLINTAVEYTGAALGSFIADPKQVAANFAIPELVGEKSAETVSNLMENSIARFKAGTQVGAAFGGSQAIQDKINADAENQDLSPLQTALTMGSQAVLGGVFSTLFGAISDKLGSFKPISENGERQLKSIAISQLLNGRDVNINAPLLQELSDQSKTLFQDLENKNIDINKVINDNNKELMNEDIDPVRAASLKMINNYLENPPEDINQSDFDEYVKKNTTPDGDFSSSPMQDLEPVEPVKNISDVTKNLELSDEELNSIAPALKEDDEYQSDLKNYNNSATRKDLIPKIIDSVIKCWGV